MAWRVCDGSRLVNLWEQCSTDICLLRGDRNAELCNAIMCSFSFTAQIQTYPFSLSGKLSYISTLGWSILILFSHYLLIQANQFLTSYYSSAYLLVTSCLSTQNLAWMTGQEKISSVLAYPVWISPFKPPRQHLSARSFIFVQYSYTCLSFWLIEERSSLLYQCRASMSLAQADMTLSLRIPFISYPITYFWKSLG